MVIASGKGGVGKTLFGTCLGTIATEQAKWKVLLVDMDYRVKGLTFLYGGTEFWKHSAGSTVDLLQRRKNSEEAITEAEIINGIAVVPAGVDFNKKIDWDLFSSDIESSIFSD